MTRAEVEAQWLVLTRETLPALASARGWPVSHDHCFQRILLDAACGARWYDQIAKRPAYRYANDAVLESAVAFAAKVIDGTINVAALNNQSLVYRGKA